ncbi:BrnT family toxin [Telmatobacter bradus]|uniref:BrnT family toxin n=1 Tax=Telmatobacter bradus TaxID=474953 RepID=UPI003B438C67
MAFEWDPRKAESNFKKHGVRFAESLPVFEDDYALTITDEESDSGEPRFVSIGSGAKGRVLVVVYAYRREKIRVISARNAETHERRAYEENR